MTDSKTHTSEQRPLQGRVFRPATPAELAEAIEQAFDYRGDVTVTLASGETVEGYLFNRVADGPRPSIHMYPKNASGARQFAYAELTAIALSGEDTASGTSWEAWVTKKESQRQLEAQQEEAAARARGHL
ncbi:MAG: hypothetical protein HZB35_11560 [Nitrospirae bacterium]|nr:hypothetical protein [Nitrospirota bacterium]